VIARPHRAHGRPDGLHHSRSLVAEHERHRPSPIPVGLVEVGVAHAAGGHAHAHEVAVGLGQLQRGVDERRPAALQDARADRHATAPATGRPPSASAPRVSTASSRSLLASAARSRERSSERVSTR
jgi:hypothetical protein